jgi:N-acetylmuramic acid 6-phosphate etherase
MENLSKLTTEQRNERTKNIDELPLGDIVRLMNKEDNKVVEAVGLILPQVEKAVMVVFNSLKSGGRLFYVGAGTSGRLGILDAVECPPTFSTHPDLIQAVMAGGTDAVYTAVEGAEDDTQQGIEDLKNRNLSNKDVVIGIAASGRTPYVASALQYAQKIQASTIALSCNADSIISGYADYPIEVVVGPEILTGSTRLKAATAQKMILNMITTSTMIKLGKVYENLMVDLNVSNHKLVERAKNIITTITGVSDEIAVNVLNNANREVKPAIVMIQANVPYDIAKKALEEANGFVRQAIETSRNV